MSGASTPTTVLPLRVSLEDAREAEDDGGGEDPAQDDEDHTPDLRGTVRYPGITYMEADDGKQEVEGIEEGLEGCRDVRLTGGGQAAPGGNISEKEIADDTHSNHTNHQQPSRAA